MTAESTSASEAPTTPPELVRPAPSERSHLAAWVGRFGLWFGSAAGAPLLGLTLLAAWVRSGHFVVLGLGALLLCVAVALGTWSPRRAGRVAAVLAVVALAPTLPILLPIPRARNGDALVRSASVFGGDGGTPWFAGFPERELVRTGERLGWGPAERATLAREGGIASTYEAFEGSGLFERSESVVLDSWVFDRGHYFVAVPPDLAPDERAPLIVFLHGNGGNFRALPGWLARDAEARGIATVYPTWGFGSWLSDEAVARVLAVIDDAARRSPVDPDRVVLVGLSAGGIGAVHVAQRHPERFRGVVTISGAPFGPFGEVIPEAAARLPFLAFHGKRDGHVRVSSTRELAEKLEAAGGEIDYREFPDEDHTLMKVRRAEIVAAILDWAVPRFGAR